MVQYEVHQTVQSGNSPETIGLRRSDDEVPPTAAEYHIDRAVVTDQSSAQNDVQIQSYDPDDNAVDAEVYQSVSTDATERPGEGEDGPLLTVPAGNTIRVAVEGDADVTLYIEPENL